MERSNYQNPTGIGWSQLMGRLVYLPGGVILTYGLWLALTA